LERRKPDGKQKDIYPVHSAGMSKEAGLHAESMVNQASSLSREETENRIVTADYRENVHF